MARALYPHVAGPWIDLSTGINPISYPAPPASRHMRNRLPETSALRELEATAGSAFGVGDTANIAAVGGTESAVRLLPHLLQVANSLVVEPTYSSHLAGWRNSNVAAAGVRYADLPERFETATALTIVNPNNPDGRRVERAQLLRLHDRVASNGGVLVVDEAFADLDPTISVAALAGSDRAPRLVVLRSFGKFFGLAGVRLGFVIAASPLIRSLREWIGDWPVAVDAIAAGLSAYADHEWMERMRGQLSEQAQRMDSLLTATGMTIVGGTSLYRLAATTTAKQKFQRLLAHGVLARPFAYDATLLRFGLPGRGDWRRLADILQACA